MKELFPVEPMQSSLLDKLWDLQNNNRYISDSDISHLAAELNISAVEVEGVVSFYHFFQRKPSGKFSIYIS